MQNLDVQYIGKVLLDRGFKDFFLYMFKIVENRPFVVEPIHNDLFQMVDDILNMRKIRLCCGICPRSAKTTICKWLIVYAWTINPKCNFIYTSYSQSLLATISNEIAGILEHPVYKAMFPHNTIYQEDLNIRPVDYFWEDYLKNEEGKNLYSTKKITTYAGGTCIFQSKGGQLTGHGAGIRNSKKFSGGIILDDFDKPSEISSTTLREKSYRYYDETLLSRLNNPNCFILNVQQRLHIADTTGYLTEKYKFDIINKPLLDENGICQIPSQYTQERIEELKQNSYLWSSQYMQNPVYRGGAVIKRSWFNYYPTNLQYKYKRIFITADTAMKVKEHNDFSCFIVNGITDDNHLHILEIVHGKWEAPELKRIAVDLFNKWKLQQETGLACSGLYIEDKASGIGLIQELKRCGIPIIGLVADKDKLTRIENVLPYIESGMVLLPNAENYGNNKTLLDECEAFTRDDTHLHDDQCLVGNTKIATLFGDKFIKNVKIGDYVLTPFGYSKVLASECTGVQNIINNIGLCGTYNHKVFCLHDNIVDFLCNMNYNNCSKLLIKDIMLWKRMKLLSLMENDIIIMDKKDIIHHDTINAIKNREQGFIETFGNFIVDKKFPKAIKFIILTAIDLIMTSIILSVFQLVNIVKNIIMTMYKYGNVKICKKLVNVVVKNVKNGTLVKKVNNGIENIKKNILKNYKLKKYAKNVEANLEHSMTTDIKFIAENVETNFLKENYEKEQKRKVYNIKTQNGMYYANGILVSNCDALAYAIQEGLAKTKVSILDFFMDN